MAREPRGMKPWTLYVYQTAKDACVEMAKQASEQAGRRIRPSAVGRALLTLALADDAMRAEAVKVAAAEPPSGPARSVKDETDDA